MVFGFCPVLLCVMIHISSSWCLSLGAGFMPAFDLRSGWGLDTIYLAGDFSGDHGLRNARDAVGLDQTEVIYWQRGTFASHYYGRDWTGAASGK